MHLEGSGCSLRLLEGLARLQVPGGGWSPGSSVTPNSPSPPAPRVILLTVLPQAPGAGSASEAIVNLSLCTDVNEWQGLPRELPHRRAQTNAVCVYTASFSPGRTGRGDFVLAPEVRGRSTGASFSQVALTRKTRKGTKREKRLFLLRGSKNTVSFCPPW